MTPTPEASERQRKAAFKAWETIRGKQAQKQVDADPILTKATEAAAEIVETADDKKTRFGLERDLQAALRENIDQLEPGLTIIDTGKEKRSPSGRIDILATDANGKIVVIELKVGTANQDVIGQILAYMGDLTAETGEPVRGIIVAHDFENKVIAASKAATNIQLRKYGFNFIFKGA